MTIEQGEQKEVQPYIEPRFTDFKVMAYTGRENDIVRVPSHPRTLADVLKVTEECTKEAYALSDHFKEDGGEAYTSLITVVGPTAGSKTTVGNMLVDHQTDVLSDMSQIMSIVISDYEEERALAFEAGKLKGLLSIDQPFEDDHIKTVVSKHEPSFADNIRDGGVVLGMKPAGTYGAIWEGAVNMRSFMVSKRPFGEETLKKLRRREPPFNDIDPQKVIWSLALAVVPSPFVNQVLGRYRNLLQVAETNKDLEMANHIQRVFKRREFGSIEELKEAREGGSLPGILRTNERAKEVVYPFYRAGILHGRINRNALIIIDDDMRGQNDTEIINAATTETYKLAKEVASFISANPSESLLRYLICFIAYTEAQIVIHQSTDLEMGDFYQKHEIEPIISMVVKSDPSMKVYDENDKKQIQELFKEK